ncbi:DUF2254 domain-containing protein [Paraconexibacter sp.]|uniref:DUF2254 domain-containing protein n=1 Tax=Paraconexibacter sp. TaxID=2949640 RepID=UPI003567DBD3
MVNRAKNVWLNVSGSLGFVPGLIVIAFGVLGIVMVEIDKDLDLDGASAVFAGDGPAARTVLSVIAGSLITVAGLTFSITMVVLQLAASQFSPRILRTFSSDRLTQVTIGTYVGTFVYAILVLRAVGSFDDASFVPRLSVTLASLLGIAAVVLLVVFLNHVTQLIQVSHVTASITHETLARTDALYPEDYGVPAQEEDAEDLLASWRGHPGGRVMARRPGFVQRVGLDDLVAGVAGRAERFAILVRPGDFVSIETTVIEVWPPEAAEDCRAAFQDAVAVTSERDLAQDVHFGLRQLTDTALKAMSPGINDPMTAVTCIGYLRALLVRVTDRAQPPGVRRFPEHDLTAVLLQRRYEEYLELLVQISRYVEGDAWVARELLDALGACAEVAHRRGAQDRLRSIRAVAAAIGARAREEAGGSRDREMIDAAMSRIAHAAG